MHRLVARDFTPKGDKDRAGQFPAMPPVLAAKHMLFRSVAAGAWERRDEKLQRRKLLLVHNHKAERQGGAGELVHDGILVGCRQTGICGNLWRWL